MISTAAGQAATAVQYGVLVTGHITRLSRGQLDHAPLPRLLSSCSYVSGVLLGAARVEALVVDCLRLADRVSS